MTSNEQERPKPTPEERALALYRRYMGKRKGDVPLSVVKDHIVQELAAEIEDGDAVDDPKARAAKAFAAVDSEERQRANEQMRSGQASFDLGEYDLIVALAGLEELDDEDGSTTTKYSRKNTARCRIGTIGMDEYLRWDFLQDANRRAANEAYDRGKARFAPYLPFFQRGLTIEEIDAQGLVRRAD